MAPGAGVHEVNAVRVGLAVEVRDVPRARDEAEVEGCVLSDLNDVIAQLCSFVDRVPHTRFTYGPLQTEIMACRSGISQESYIKILVCYLVTESAKGELYHLESQWEAQGLVHLVSSTANNSL